MRLTFVARTEDGHACELSIELGCVKTAHNSWLPRRHQLTRHHLTPVDTAKERVTFHLSNMYTRIHEQAVSMCSDTLSVWRACSADRQAVGQHVLDAVGIRP